MSKKNRSGHRESGEKKDKSPYVYQEKKLDFELHMRERNNLTEKQKTIIELIQDKNTKCIMIDGFYGTGKSYTAILGGLKLLNDKKVSQVVFIRNPIESSSCGKLGFLPSTVEDKMAPYNVIFYDKLAEFLPKLEIDFLKKNKFIDTIPLGFARGLSWDCKYIIVDEATSMTYDDLILLMTRCGKFTKIIFLGDSENQNDIGNKSGFKKMFDKLNDIECKENGIYCLELKEKNDIVRSQFLQFLMQKLGILK